MSAYALSGYKDEDDEYHGFLGCLEIEEYSLLKKLTEKCTYPDLLSVDKLKTLAR